MAPGTWQPGAALLDFLENAKVEYRRQTGRPPETVYMTDGHLEDIKEYLEMSGMLRPGSKLRSSTRPTIMGMKIVIVRNPAVGQ